MRAEDTARSLRAIGRPALAAIVDADGETPLLDYAARLHAHAPEGPLEPALAAAFRDELTRLGHPAITVSAAMADLEARRVLQTATHVTASEGPIFLAMHRMATIGLDPSLPYLVGACSGIPFSNDAHPGCLNLGRRYPLSAVLEPGSPAHRAMRDASVFHAAIPEATREVRAALRAELRAVVPEAHAGAPFVPWALATASALMRHCLDRAPVYLDLNAVVARYLATALDDGRHPLHRLLFDASTRARVLGALPPMPLFTTARGPRGLFEPLRAEGDSLHGPHGERALTPSSVLHGLREGELCPGVYLVFAALALQNGFRCLGGVERPTTTPPAPSSASSYDGKTTPPSPRTSRASFSRHTFALATSSRLRPARAVAVHVKSKPGLRARAIGGANGGSPRCARMATTTSRSEMSATIARLPLHGPAKTSTR
ncbi:MAG: hypothetical protein ACMG6S_12180 [Byssovorax sp.]